MEERGPKAFRIGCNNALLPLLGSHSSHLLCSQDKTSQRKIMIIVNSEKVCNIS